MTVTNNQQSTKGAVMYVGVQHRIKDAEEMFARGETIAEKAPAGITPLQFFPSTDLTTATCLWQADSVQSVQEYTDSVLGDSSENSYYEISSEHAIGLPQPAASKA
jgi:hypothetical protein